MWRKKLNDKEELQTQLDLHKEIIEALLNHLKLEWSYRDRIYIKKPKK